MTLNLPRNETLLMAPGSLAGPAGAGVRHVEQASGIQATFTVDAGGTNSTVIVSCGSCAAGWIGRLIEVREGATDTDTIKHHAIITNVTAGTEFKIWPALPAALTSGDTFSVFESPLPYLVDTAGASATSITDASMTGWANDEPNGYFAYCIYSAGSIVVGEMKQITDHVNGAATTVAAFSASVTAADFFLIVKPIGSEDLDFQTPQNMLARMPTRDNPAPSMKYPAERRPTVAFKVPLKGIGDALGNGEDWATKAKNESMLLCKELMGSFLDTDEGEVTTGVGSTSTRTITTGTGDEQFTPGNAVMHEGEMSVISTITDGAGGDDTLNFVVASGGGPLFSAAATTGDTVNACAMAEQATDGSQYPISFLYFQDQMLKLAMGCTGDLNVESSPNGRLMLSFTLNECQGWGVQSNTIPSTLDDSHYPETQVSDIRVANGRVLFASTAIECQDTQIALGTEVVAREDPNAWEGNRGGLMLPGNPVATLSGHPIESISHYERVDQVALTGQVFCQYNKVAGNSIGVVFPKAQFSAAAINKGPITRIDLTIDAVRPDSTDPRGTPIRIFWG